MKLLAARAGAESDQEDARDIALLIRLLGITEADSVLNIVRRYYDPSPILPRSIYLVDEILEELSNQ